MDNIMITAISLYCGNSVAEKGIVSYFSGRKEESPGENG